MPRVLSFDAAETLIGLRRPVADVYQDFAARHGLNVSADALKMAFATVFSSYPDPIYSEVAEPNSLACRPQPTSDSHSLGHNIEVNWWREVVFRTFEKASNQTRSDTWQNLFDDLFNHYEEAASWEVYPDTIPALTRAKDAGATLIVVSNFDLRLHPILQNLGLSQYFNLVVSSADALARKPNAAIFRYIERRLSDLGIRATDYFHIGDSESRDVVGARDAGWQAFHLQRPETTLGDFVDCALRD